MSARTVASTRTVTSTRTVLSALAVAPLVLTIVAAVPPAQAPSSAAQVAPVRTAFVASSVADIPKHPKKAKKNTKTLVIMAYSKHKDSATPKRLKAVWFDQFDRWIRTESSGRVGTTGRVTRWLRIASTSCTNTYRVEALARKAAQRAHYNPLHYTRIVVYFPHCRGIFWAGLGSVGGDGTGHYSVLLNGASDLSVVAHESLHNYGIEHAASASCGTGQHPVSFPKRLSSCDTNEYGDPFDVMGNEGIGLSAASKLQLGWLTSAQRTTVAHGSKTLTLVATEASGSGRRLVRIPMGGGDYLDVEYRAAIGVDAAINTKEDVFAGVGATSGGVQVRYTQKHLIRHDLAHTLIDTQALNPTAVASIPAGSSWTSWNGIRVWVASVGPRSARVTVTHGAPRPGKPSTPTAATIDTSGAPLTVRLASIPDGHGMPVTGFDFELLDANGGTDQTSTDSHGAGAVSAQFFTTSYGIAYRVRVRARSEVGASAWSEYSSAVTIPEPIPVIVTSIDDGATLAPGYSLESLRVRVTATDAEATIQNVYISVTHADGSWTQPCTPVPVAASSDTWQCDPASLDPLYATLTPDQYTLTVDAYDSHAHQAARTVSFTVQ
ncbi:hypothetical protein BH11ACT2_BH11ACT2_00300 [soil metagenome]